MKEKLNKVAKVTLLVCTFLLLGLGIYYTYLSIRFRPYKVRVSNVTDSAFTVSWVTDEPMVGVVYYGDKDSFLPGPLSWLGKKRAFDDRDVSDAQTECVSKFNKKVSKNRDENFTVDVSGFDCNEVKVIKKGQYYTHHVTVPNLDADKEYYFRVGNGYISFKEGKTKGVEYIEREMPAVGEFKQKTRETIKDISSPKPAYGTSYNVFYSSDGQVGTKKSFDSVIFLKTFKEGTEYPLMSAVTNSDGGWSIDLSNVRDEDNNILAMEDTYLEFIPQVDNARPGASGTTKFESLSFPLNLMGNNVDDLKDSGKKEEVKGVRLLNELINKSYAANCHCKISSSVCIDMSESLCEDQGGTCVSSCSTTPPPAQNWIKCWSFSNNKCIETSVNRSVCDGGGYFVSEVACCSKNPCGVDKTCYSCVQGELKERATRGDCYSDESEKKLDCTATKTCYWCANGELKSRTLTTSTAECSTVESETPLECEETVACFCWENDCKNPIVKDGKNCEDIEGCYPKKAACLENYQKSCCKVAGTGSSGTTCSCKFKDSCDDDEVESNKADCEACFKVIRGECKNGCREHHIVNTCTESGENPETIVEKLSPFKKFVVNRSYAQGLEEMDGVLNVCPTGQASCEDEGGAPDGSCFFRASTITRGSDYNTIQFEAVIPSYGGGSGGTRPNCLNFGGDIREGWVCYLPPKLGETQQECTSFTMAIGPEKGPIRCYPRYSCDFNAAYWTTAADCGDDFSSRDECRFLLNSIPFCDFNSSSDFDFVPTEACVCPLGTANSYRIIGPDSNLRNCGFQDYELDACWLPVPNEPRCSVYKRNMKYSDCLREFGNPSEVDCLSNNGYICWEWDSAKNGCVPSSVNRELNMDCSGDGLFSTLRECNGGKYYIPLLEEGRCDEVSDDEMYSSSNSFATLEDCMDYVNSFLSSNVISSSQRCNSRYACNCTEAQGGYVSPGSCCGSTRYTFSQTRNIVPTLANTECRVDTTSNPNASNFCSMEECLIARQSVQFEAIGWLGDNRMVFYEDSYDQTSQKVCAQASGGECSLYELQDAVMEDLSPCDRSKCGIVDPDDDGSQGLVHRAYAQEESDVQWDDNVVFYSPEDSVYQVVSSDGVSRTILGGQATVFYYEGNGVEGYQPPVDPENPREGEDRIVSGASLTISKVAELKKLSLKKGINLISFNLLPTLGTAEEKLTFKDFLQIANRDSKNVSRISVFRAGKWEGGATYDFTTKEVKGLAGEALSMGIGYIVVAEKDVEISVPGYAIESPVPVAFSSGWNLIGVHGHDTQYTAKSLINSVNSIEGLKANNVTYWPTSKGMYQGFQLSEGQEYGQDFPISKDLGYFVRINEIKEDCRSIWWNPDGEGNGKCNSQ